MFVIFISSEYTQLYRLAYVNPASMLSRATVDPQAKRHPNGVPIHRWPIAAHSYVLLENVGHRVKGVENICRCGHMSIINRLDV